MANADSASSVDNIVLTQAGGTFVIDDIGCDSSFDNITLTQTLSYNLNPNIFVNTGAVAVQYTGLKISVWDTGSRPPPVMGLIGFNTTTQAIEVYDGSAWV
jgi:hypothetical protein